MRPSTKKTRVRVLHRHYGCESGCCGHIVEIDGEEEWCSFDFSHRGETMDGLKSLILKAVRPECHDTIDWSTVEVLEECEW